MKTIGSLMFGVSLLAAAVPSSERSKDAIARRTPSLQAEVAAAGLVWGGELFFRLFKDPGILEVWIRNGKRFELFKTYPICTYGGGGLGPKLKEGDGMAPEGFYAITPRQLNPLSNYHLAFNVGYPNEYDRIQGRTGSALMIHGNCVSIGCYAMTDPVIEELYTLVDAAFQHGQDSIALHLLPFPLTSSRLAQAVNSPWREFWDNLRIGYDLFGKDRIPPRVRVKNGKYLFISGKKS